METRPRMFQLVAAVVAAGLSMVSSPGLAADSNAGPSETAPAEQSESSAGVEASRGDDGVAFQLRSLRVGLGTGPMVGLDWYSALGRLNIDFYHLPSLEGALDRECFRPNRTCRSRTHLELTWSTVATSKWLQGGFEAGLAGGHLVYQHRVTWRGPAVGPLVGLHGSVTPLETFGVGLQLGAAPVY